MIDNRKISIIIVNFNTAKYVLDCLFSIYNSNFPKEDLEVIVVDNASKEELRIKNYELRIKLIKNKQNVGFAVANNQGIKQAKGEYILLLNPDTLVEKETLTTMIDFMEKNSRVGVTTCRINLSNGELDDACHRGFPTPWRAFCQFSGLSALFPDSLLLNGYHLGYKDLDKIHEIEAVAGAFMLIRRKVGEEVGWLDEDYFWYGEDLDFCYRVKQKGWKVMFVPTVKILHYKGVSGGIKTHSKDISTADEDTRKLATRTRFEVMKIFYKKHYQKIYPKSMTWFVLGGIRIKEYISLLRLRLI
jgi:GT2 family glycosyltransferase